MTPKIIQFGELDAFAAEDLGKGNIVRVTILDITQSQSSQIPGLRVVGVGVHGRAINNEGHILACYLPVAQLQLYNGRLDGDPAWQAYDEAWEKAEALKERVIVYLNSIAADKGFTVRPAGVIDLGETMPLRAIWPSDPLRQQKCEATDG